MEIRVDEFFIPMPHIILAMAYRILLFFLPTYVEKGKPLEQKKKVLFVVNHNLIGLDMLNLWAVLYLNTGIAPHGLTDRFLFVIPFVSQIMGYVLGCFPGLRPVAEKAFSRGYNMLVFPGGSQEAFRSKKHEKYSLNWGKRDGFVRFALRHGYTIVPVSSVGIEDFFKILFDIPMNAMLRLAGDNRPHISIPIVLPVSYERQYFSIGDPIVTEGMEYTEENVAKIRQKSYEVVEGGIKHLKEVRKSDSRHQIVKTRYMVLATAAFWLAAAVAVKHFLF
jgi:1-acyl-sn-glycerol-3-phosphate acyltransferase